VRRWGESCFGEGQFRERRRRVGGLRNGWKTEVGTLDREGNAKEQQINVSSNNGNSNRRRYTTHNRPWRYWAV
jgi:hypothetical protein